ncbi:MAG: maleylpyruvate isomerase family mycothiol-dependent enzyme [Nocardioidaceae bacterium]
MNALKQQVDVWRSACADFSALAKELSESEWQLPTDCPGWSAGDTVAHCAAVESELAGDEPLRVTIDKEAPHIKHPSGIYTERGVVARRGRSRDQVIAEFDDAVLRRTALLEAEALDDPAGDPPITPGGIGWSWGTLLRNRPLDLWVHEQDIRRAVGRPGGLDSVAARHAQGVFAAVLPYIIAKEAQAPPGTTVVFDVTGPLPAVYAVEVNDEGRGVAMESPPDNPTLRITLDTESFTILGAGRRDPATLPIKIDVGADLDEVSGHELATLILREMTVTP